jgi:hypothetical protein
LALRLALERSGRQLFGGVNPRKKHSPWVVADLRVVTPCGDLGQEIDASRSPASPFVILASTMRPITIKYNFTDLPKVCAKGRSCAVEGSFATRESSRIAQISGRSFERAKRATKAPRKEDFINQNHILNIFANRLELSNSKSQTIDIVHILLPSKSVR